MKMYCIGFSCQVIDLIPNEVDRLIFMYCSLVGIGYFLNKSIGVGYTVRERRKTMNLPYEVKSKHVKYTFAKILF